jgi:hypothetical protein
MTAACRAVPDLLRLSVRQRHRPKPSELRTHTHARTLTTASASSALRGIATAATPLPEGSRPSCGGVAAGVSAPTCISGAIAYPCTHTNPPAR